MSHVKRAGTIPISNDCEVVLLAGVFYQVAPPTPPPLTAWQRWFTEHHGKSNG